MAENVETNVWKMQMQMQMQMQMVEARRRMGEKRKKARAERSGLQSSVCRGEFPYTRWSSLARSITLD